jgi:hypothetical protein
MGELGASAEEREEGRGCALSPLIGSRRRTEDLWAPPTSWRGGWLVYGVIVELTRSLVYSERSSQAHKDEDPSLPCHLPPHLQPLPYSSPLSPYSYPLVSISRA